MKQTAPNTIVETLFMTIVYRSIIALTIAAALAGCDTDTAPTVPLPNEPEPLIPAPAKPFDAQIGNVTIKATKEELVVTSNTEDDKLASVESFKGIQYAEAQRFEHSAPVALADLLNSESIIDATSFGDACPQNKSTNFSADLELGQSEDCLTLNIWRPEGTTEQDDLPVYVFIHGGDFEYGTGANPMIHGDTVVAQGADEGNEFIAVTFNYRLGLLGSNWVKGAHVNGNYGLEDQETLLKWIQKNIKDFGGNAGNITLMGQGAGAMSIALLQQKVGNSNLDEIYFQRAIMQSMPYGFEYKSYNVAKDQASDTELLKGLPFTEVLDVQSATLAPLQRLKNWLLSSLDIPLLSPKSDNTPMATLMPYAPYLECSEVKDGLFEDKSSCKDGMDHAQPSQSNFVVPTVIGVNAQDSDSISMLPNLTSLVTIICDELNCFAGDEPELTAQKMSEWLTIDGNKELVEQRIYTLTSSEEFSVQLDLQDLIDALPNSAYEAITPLFFGLKNQTGSDLLELFDFHPNSESEIQGAIDNMSQYRTIMNDMLFTGPARMQADQSDDATMYYFAHSPSFNVWTYNTGPNGETDIGDFLKSISCITGACNGSELPFVFNKSMKMDGTETRPSSTDKKLMNEISRSWFDGTLFSDANKYNANEDRVLVIDADGIALSDRNWDKTNNPGKDNNLRQGRLTGLKEQEILLNYMPDYTIPEKQ